MVNNLETSYPWESWNVQERNFIYYDRNFSQSSHFHHLGYALYSSNTDFIPAMNAPIKKRHNQSENWITVVVSRRTSKSCLFSLHMQHLVLHSLMRTSNTILEVMLVVFFGVMLWKNDITDRKMFTKLSTYTLPWYTQTWLRTQKLQSFVVFPLFQS